MRRLVVGRYSAGGGVCRKRRRADTVGFRTKGLSAAGGGMCAPDIFPAEKFRKNRAGAPAFASARSPFVVAGGVSGLVPFSPENRRGRNRSAEFGRFSHGRPGKSRTLQDRPDGLYAVAPPGRIVRDRLRPIRKAEGKGKRRWPESGPLFGFVLGRFSLSGPEAVRPYRNGCFRNGISGSGSFGSVLRRPRVDGYSRVVSSPSERISNVGFSGPAGFPAGLNQTESMPERTAPAMSVS